MIAICRYVKAEVGGSSSGEGRGRQWQSGDCAALQISLTIISIVIIHIDMEDNIGIQIADTARLMRRSFDAQARGIGVTRPQWQVLSMLRRNEGINQGGLAEILDVEPITICRMVDRLQEAGLVERRTDPADRRSWRLHVTAKASELLNRLQPLADDVFEAALYGLGTKERDQLSALLNRVRANLTQRNTGAVASNG